MVTKIKQFEPPAIEQGDEVAGHGPGFVEIRKLTCPVPLEDITTATSRASFQSEVLLGSLRDGRFRVLSPITVKLSTEGEHVIAEAVEFNEFGFGKNLSEALVDLQGAIAQLYFTLEQEQDHLSHDLRSVWAALQQKTQKR